MKLPTTRAFRRRKVHRWRWRRRWKVLVLDLLGREESPERVAAAIGLGVAIGFSPFIGLHLVMALALAFLFRLNKLDAVLGTLTGNVPTWGVVFPLGFRLGRTILRYDRRIVPRLNLEPLLHSDFTWIFHPVHTLHVVFGHRALWPRLLSFVVGTTILAVALGFLAALITVGILRAYHRRHPRVAIRAANRRRAVEEGETEGRESGLASRATNESETPAVLRGQLDREPSDQRERDGRGTPRAN
ncbi:MAG: DUF2062 domain-containing protein [Acidobacteriota bacterium]|nr:DUF2062 domain-containing protein [Acidobacteriota bacterium]